MRIHLLAVAVVCLALAACASNPSAANTPVVAQCTKGVVATVANPRAVMYDVYYSPPGKAASIIGEVSPGSTVTFTVTYPSILAAGSQYWKYGPTGSQPAAHWYILPATLAGNTAVFSITDGGPGDDDLAANGTVVDQGGPGVPGAGVALPVPTLSEWAMALLALMLFGFAARRIKAP